MSWDDFYRRQAVIRAVLKEAERDPTGPLPFEQIPQAKEEFADRDELLLALYHKWTRMLDGKVALALHEADNDPHLNGVDAVARSWHELVEQEPVLRRILDTHEVRARDVVREAAERERRMLALAAGLADPAEPIGEVTHIGAAFVALIRTGRASNVTTAPPLPADDDEWHRDDLDSEIRE